MSVGYEKKAIAVLGKFCGAFGKFSGVLRKSSGRRRRIYGVLRKAPGRHCKNGPMSRKPFTASAFNKEERKYLVHRLL